MSPVDTTKCFAVRRGEITGRADVNFWRLTPVFRERFAKPNYAAVELGSLVELVQYGCSALARPEPVGVPMLRMNNLQEDGWDLTDLKYIQMDDEDLERYRLTPGDLLFNRTNSKELVGKCEVFREKGDWVFASYLIRVRLQTAKVLPQFASDFLATNSGRLQIDRLSRQIIGMTNINAEELRTILLPLPPLPKQREFVAAMDKARAARRSKLAESDSLLAEMDMIVLDALGLARMFAQTAVFAVRRGDVAERIDADFNSPKFRAIQAAIRAGRFPARALSEVCQPLVTGFAAGKQDQAFDLETGIPHLRPLNLNTHGEISIADTKYVPISSVDDADICQPSEVLFNNTNSTEMVGKSAVFELAQACACSNHMTRIRLLPGGDPHYVAALFNALRSLGYFGLLSTNFNNQAGINTTTLNRVAIPFPPEAEQKRVAAEVRRLRAKAALLRGDAAKNWQEAKATFEGELLQRRKN